VGHAPPRAAIKEIMIPSCCRSWFRSWSGLGFGLDRRARAAGAPRHWAGVLMGTIVTGPLSVAISMTTGGGAWDKPRNTSRTDPNGGKGFGRPQGRGHRRHGGKTLTRTRPARRSNPAHQDHQHRGPLLIVPLMV